MDAAAQPAPAAGASQMKPLDRFLQDLRIRQALPFIREGEALLDIGCFDRVLLERVSARVSRAVGIDPLATEYSRGNVQIHRGLVGSGKPGEHPFGPASFDCITLLAVLEHIPDTPAIARECARLLRPNGRVIITVPHPRVDTILAVLTRLRLVKGMSLEEHFGYDVNKTPDYFGAAGLTLSTRKTFELGLNYLFVFTKTTPTRTEPPA